MTNSVLDLLIVGDVVRDGKILREGGIGVQAGRIAGWFAPGYAPAAREQVDATGLLILPGFIDAHVHCASTPFEGVPAATAAAAMAASSCGAMAAKKCRQRRVERKRIRSSANAMRLR